MMYQVGSTNILFSQTTFGPSTSFRLMFYKLSTIMLNVDCNVNCLLTNVISLPLLLEIATLEDIPIGLLEM